MMVDKACFLSFFSQSNKQDQVWQHRYVDRSWFSSLLLIAQATSSVLIHRYYRQTAQFKFSSVQMMLR